MEEKCAPAIDDSFQCKFSDPPQKPLTQHQYFRLFLTDEAVALITERTNAYSVQKRCKSIDVSESDIATFVGRNMLMGVVKQPSYKNYWSQKLRYPIIGNAMPIKRFEKIKRYLHSIINLVRNECIKVEPEEFNEEVTTEEFKTKLNVFITRKTRPKLLVSDKAQVFKATAMWMWTKKIRKNEKLIE